MRFGRDYWPLARILQGQPGYNERVEGESATSFAGVFGHSGRFFGPNSDYDYANLLYNKGERTCVPKD